MAHVPSVQRVLKTVMVSHAQLLDKMVVDPRTMQRQGPDLEVLMVEVPKTRFISWPTYPWSRNNGLGR